MKTVWDKYKLIIILILAVVLAFTGTVMYYRHKVAGLQHKLYDKEIEFILKADSMREDFLNRRQTEIDSLIRSEQYRYDSLLLKYNQTKRSYEKIYNDYSSIVIDRPEF